jgi:flagellar protein FlaI
MAKTKDQTGTKKEVTEQAEKADAELKKRRKSKFGKIAAGKKQQLAEKRNIKDLDAEKMASSLSSDNTAAMPEAEATMIQEISGGSEHDSEKTPELESDILSEPLPEQSSEPESEKLSELVLEQSPELESEKLSEPLPEQSPELELDKLSEPLPEQSSEPESDKLPEPVPEHPSETESDKFVSVQVMEEIDKSEKEHTPGRKPKGKRLKPPMKKDEKALSDEKTRKEDIDSIMQRFEGDNTRELISEKLTPEKQAAYDIFEEKLVSDIETRIKKLKEMQGQEVKKPEKLIDKIKLFITKEQEEKETYDPAFHGPLVTFEGISGYTELERYWVNEPYALVVILFNPEKNSNVYYVVEPKLSEFEKLFLNEIKDRLKDVLLFEDIKSEENKDKILTEKVRKLVRDYAIDVTPLITEKILYYTRRDFIKFGKIDALMHDDRIEDISANGFDIPIYLYHKKYTNLATSVVFTESELDSYVIRLAQRCGKHISIAEPMIDATMPDGSRIQMTLGTAVTTHGATFTIRKFSEVPITPVDLINWHTFSAEEMAYLWLCIENNKSLIYAGGTASGKTSSLNAVSLFIPWQAKIITLEDTRELKLPHPNWIPGVTRDSFSPDGKGSIDMYDLLKAALRQRPEFLLVGEVRGKEALTLFQAMSTGHTTFSTMHADSVSSAIHRLENPPISVPRTMIQALNIISIQSQTFVKGKRARRNMKLVEITDIDPTTRNIKTNDIFVWDALTDKFNRVGESKALAEITLRRGWSQADLKKELLNRQKILEFMVNNKIFDFNAIATIIHDYQVTPDKVLKKLMITG